MPPDAFFLTFVGAFFVRRASLLRRGNLRRVFVAARPVRRLRQVPPIAVAAFALLVRVAKHSALLHRGADLCLDEPVKPLVAENQCHLQIDRYVI